MPTTRSRSRATKEPSVEELKEGIDIIRKGIDIIIQGQEAILRALCWLFFIQFLNLFRG